MAEEQQQQDFWDKLAEMAREKRLASFTIARKNRGTDEFEVLDRLDHCLTFDAFRKKYRGGTYQLRGNAKQGGIGCYEHSIHIADEGPDLVNSSVPGMNGYPAAHIDAAEIARIVALATAEAIKPIIAQVQQLAQRGPQPAQPAVDPIAQMIDGMNKFAAMGTAIDGVRDALTARDKRIRKETLDEAAQVAEQAEDEAGEDDEESGVGEQLAQGLLGLVNNITGGGEPDDLDGQLDTETGDDVLDGEHGKEAA